MMALMSKAPESVPVADIDLSKRKREDEDITTVMENGDVPNSKRQRSETTGTVIMAETSKTDDAIVDRGVKATACARAIIESEVGLEILLKHKELRRINQEIAKCQIALEQLRRCHLIPYPGTTGLSQAVSNGTGPALSRPGVKPQWAPSFGITEGPYSRHYAKWLIPDPSFDGVQSDWETLPSGKTVPEGRSTRHSYSEGFGAPTKSRSRGSTGQKLQALPSGYALTKENQGPSVLKRADGQMVKLVCLDCHRENFGSTQGFINHCRIAHRREFKSHEEAASQSGQAIDVNEAPRIVADEKPTPAAPIATGLVHPLIRSASPDKAAYLAVLSRIATSMDMFNAGELPGVTSIPGSATSSPVKPVSRASKPHPNFVPSSSTPHLSALLKSRGFDGDLSSIVAESKRRVDIEESSDSEVDEHHSYSPVATDTLSSGAMRMLPRPGVPSTPFKRPTSSKGAESMVSRKPGISPRLPFATPSIDTDAANRNMPRLPDSEASSPRDIGHDTPMLELSPSSSEAFNINLSPNTTASNNAPSLVSDDDEYDDAGAESEIESDKWDGEDDDSDRAEIVDVELVRRGNSGEDHTHSHGMAQKERHVTFVSPVKEKKKKIGVKS